MPAAVISTYLMMGSARNALKVVQSVSQKPCALNAHTSRFLTMASVLTTVLKAVTKTLGITSAWPVIKGAVTASLKTHA